MAKANSKRNGSVPAVGYIRMSSDKQEASPDQQRGEIRNLQPATDTTPVEWRAL